MLGKMLGKRYCLAGLAILLVAVSALIAQQTSTPTSRELIVVDSTGKSLGPVIGADALGNTTVAFPFHGKPLPIAVMRSSYDQGAMYFETTDCTGQPFEPVLNPFLMTNVFGANNTLYVENGPAQSVTVQSQMFPPPSTCSTTTLTLSPAVPVTKVVDLNQVFTPPFSVVVK